MNPNRPGKIWRYADGAVPNLLVFAYIITGHTAGIFLMSTGHVAGFLAGLLFTGHTLVMAGYMIHELAHQLVFRQKILTSVVGEFLSWLCGAAYAPFRRIQLMHMRHHGDRADLSLFDHQAFLRQSPGIFRRLVYALEWLHIPAVELIMHYQVVLRPFINSDYQHERLRVLVVGISRAVFFYLIFLTSPLALAGYACSYLLFLKALFLADAYAHTYEAYILKQQNELVPREGRDAVYDRAHTYSNLISTRWPWLNLLNLNFGYHTAHHDLPSTPWYRLPALHRKTYPADAPQILPYRELCYSIHHNRLKCIMADDFGDVSTGKGRADDFLGVHGVSFLSIV